MDYCKDCKHKEEDDDMYSPSSGMLGIAIFGFPLPNPNRGELECRNVQSLHYGHKVGKYDTCSGFKSRY